ncbi:ferredoxin family protein [Natronospora cellulosivora (SeqCode)]
MTTFDKDNRDPLKNVMILSAAESHIKIKSKKPCLSNCENKPCTYYCPSRVFSWSGDDQEIKVDYTRCMECGACPWGCPYDNIDWHYPPAGYGVHYEI